MAVTSQNHYSCTLPAATAIQPQPLQAPAVVAAPCPQPFSAAPATPPCGAGPGRALPRSPFDCAGTPFAPACGGQLLAPAAAHAAVREHSEAVSWLIGWSRLATEGSPRSVASSPATRSAGSPLVDAGSITRTSPGPMRAAAPLSSGSGASASRHLPRPASPSPSRAHQRKRQHRAEEAPPGKRHAAAALPPATCAPVAEPPAWLLEGLSWELREVAVQAW